MNDYINFNSKVNNETDEKLFQKYLETGYEYYLMEISPLFYARNIIDKYAEVIINKYPKLINKLYRNSYLLEKCLERKRYDLVLKFDAAAFTEELLSKYGLDLINSFEKLPIELSYNEELLFFCLEQKRYDLVEQFNDAVFKDEDGQYMTEDIYDLMEDYAKDLALKCQNVPGVLRNSKKFREMCIDLKREDLVLQFTVNVSILDNKDELRKYAEVLEVSVEELQEKLNYLYQVNDDIFNTLRIEMLSKRMNKFNIKDIEKMALYDDVQTMVLSLSDNELNILLKAMDLVSTNKYDNMPIIYKLLNNFDRYSELLQSIDGENLAKEMLENLLTVLQSKNNYYKIKSGNDLELSNYDLARQRKDAEVTQRIKDKSISLEELKDALMHKKFGIDIENAKFICQRYCEDINIMKESELDIKTRRILSNIENILKCQDIDKLSFFYQTTRMLNADYSTIVQLEEKIRNEYAELYSNSLYKIKDEHKLQRNINVSNAMFDELNQFQYKGKKPNIYVADGDFNMQVHVLGAYEEKPKSSNFKEDWLRPKIAYHGICTSYIGNNQIAPAVGEGGYQLTYGFDSCEGKSLLSSSISNVVAFRTLNRYASALDDLGGEVVFYTPNRMIDKTRDFESGHNQMINERRNISGGETFKKLPSYVVCFVDDLNDMVNFDENYFEETVQAAVQFDIPIIIVDKVKYALSEKKKIEDRIKKFKLNPNTDDLRYIITNYCNKLFELEFCHNTKSDKYMNSFTIDGFSDIFNDLKNFIITLDGSKSDLLLAELNDLVGENVSLQRIIIEGKKTEIAVDNDKKDGSVDVLAQIMTYYLAATDEIKKELVIDMNELSYYEVVAKINSGGYEVGLKRNELK